MRENGLVTTNCPRRLVCPWNSISLGHVVSFGHESGSIETVTSAQVSGPPVRLSSNTMSPFASGPHSPFSSARATSRSPLAPSSRRLSLPPIESGRPVTQAASPIRAMNRPLRSTFTSSREGGAAAARRLRVRVAELEPRRRLSDDIVDLRAREVLHAHRVGADLHAVLLPD